MDFKKIVDTVKSEASDAVEVTKLRSKISKERSAVKANYQKIGEMIFEKYKDGGADEELAAIIDEIKASRAKIKDCNEAINKLKMED
ncbi:MAG: hypothetical protein IKO61_11350 [Lachnospiraceae bacterium]|nr:hypothetical protein [Lachnospiraceae bacterium]